MALTVKMLRLQSRLLWPAQVQCVMTVLGASSRTAQGRASSSTAVNQVMGQESPSQDPPTPDNTVDPISVSRHQLVNYILDQVLYQDDHILAFNKPNGLPIIVPQSNLFGSSQIYLDCVIADKDKASGDDSSLQGKITQHRQRTVNKPFETSLSTRDILPDLQEQVNCPALEIGMTLPRLYSGIVVLTKTDAAKKKLKKYLETVRTQRQCFQSFSCLTVGIPSAPERDIEAVTCKLGEIDGRTMTLPTDDASINALKKGLAMRLEVQLQILAENKRLGCAHMEIKPTRDKWDVVEWYCTRRLCSVLGDHVYSPRVGSVLGVPAHVEPHVALPKPQTLPKLMLQKLGIKQHFVSSIPLHVHRGSVHLAGFPTKTSDPITITAPLPGFFQHNLSQLNLHVDR